MGGGPGEPPRADGVLWSPPHAPRPGPIPGAGWGPGVQHPMGGSCHPDCTPCLGRAFQPQDPRGDPVRQQGGPRLP
eukprot:14294494-Alexandrium_andersonii.AAC.1